MATETICADSRFPAAVSAARALLQSSEDGKHLFV